MVCRRRSLRVILTRGRARIIPWCGPWVGRKVLSCLCGCRRVCGGSMEEEYVQVRRSPRTTGSTRIPTIGSPMDTRPGLIGRYRHSVVLRQYVGRYRPPQQGGQNGSVACTAKVLPGSRQLHGRWRQVGEAERRTPSGFAGCSSTARAPFKISICAQDCQGNFCCLCRALMPRRWNHRSRIGHLATLRGIFVSSLHEPALLQNHQLPSLNEVT